MAFDSSGNLWVSDNVFGRVVEFQDATAANISPIVAGRAIVADHSNSTGVKVSITGVPAPNGSYVYSARLKSLPPTTPSVGLSNPQYYDVSVFGVSNGQATVCAFDSRVTFSTQMKYLSAGTWLDASGISVTSGSSVCGSIGVSALSGSLVSIGPLSPTMTGTGTTQSKTGTTSLTTTSVTGGEPTVSTNASSNSGNSTAVLSTISTATETSGEGIPEFPYQLVTMTIFVTLLVASYFLIRRKRPASEPSVQPR